MSFIQEFWAVLNSSTLAPDLGGWSYLLIAILACLEGPVVTLIAATIAGTGGLNPWLVFLAAGVGNFSGDAGWYTLGYLGQFDTLKRYVPGLARFDPQISRWQQDIHQKVVSRLLLTKLSLSWAVIPTIVTAGMARVAWSRLLLADLLAEVVWTGSLTLAGFYLGNHLTKLELGLKILATVGGVASMITLIGPVRKFITSIICKNNQILSGDNS